MSRLLISVPTEALFEAIAASRDDVDLVRWDMTGPAPASSIDIVVPPYMVGNAVLAQLATVTTRLVQSQLNGFDGVADVLPAGVVYANAASVHETSTAELTLALILASQRGIPDFVRAAQRGQWERAYHESVADRRVLLVGYGGVARAIEDRLLPFETTVVRLARHERVDERGMVHGFDALHEQLALADIVVVVVPLDESTQGLINDAFLSSMRDGTLLVNIARGKVADTDALLAHASSGRLRLALDVTDPEPLPDGHPLFTLPNVLISPHVGGATSAMLPRMARLLNDQIDRLLRGDEPVNVVLRT
ncbi:MAG: 2-hydroxyacid dehydrogenase [Acidimicrobiales bacterium]